MPHSQFPDETDQNQTAHSTDTARLTALPPIRVTVLDMAVHPPQTDMKQRTPEALIQPPRDPGWNSMAQDHQNNNDHLGTSLAIQWLESYCYYAWAWDRSLVREQRSHMLHSTTPLSKKKIIMTTWPSTVLAKSPCSGPCGPRWEIGVCENFAKNALVPLTSNPFRQKSLSESTE